jgi:hypothetical protein
MNTTPLWHSDALFALALIFGLVLIAAAGLAWFAVVKPFIDKLGGDDDLN